MILLERFFFTWGQRRNKCLAHECNIDALYPASYWLIIWKIKTHGMRIHRWTFVRKNHVHQWLQNYSHKNWWHGYWYINFNWCCLLLMNDFSQFQKSHQYERKSDKEWQKDCDPSWCLSMPFLMTFIDGSSNGANVVRRTFKWCCLLPLANLMLLPHNFIST